MGGHVDRETVAAPIRYNEQAVIFVTQTGAEATSITFFDTQNFEFVQRFEIQRAVQDLAVISTGALPVIAANLVDGSCYVQGVGSPMPLLERGRCKVQVGYDANGDNIPELIRMGAAGLGLLDVVIGDDIALEADINVDAAAYDGERVITATGDGQTLRVNYHDHIDLNTVQDPHTNIANGSVFTRIEIHSDPEEFRILAQFERGGLQYLRVFEPGERLRKVADFGPYRVLDWRIGADADGNGKPDLKVIGGSAEGGFNTNLDYRSLRNGETVYEVGALRGVRFSPTWLNSVPPTSADVDGCGDIDYVLLRESTEDDVGQRTTRVLYRDSDDVVIYRSDGFMGQVHALAIADLDGNDQPELIELRSEGNTSARLRILGAHTGSVETP
jgi:hypothetical protein